MSDTQIACGNSLDVLRRVPENTFHSIPSDPPYGLGFMGKGWDKVLPDPRLWAEALRVARPGAHMALFGAPRVFHRLACQVEDQGWELRDCLMWLYGSGFPKSLDVSKAMDKAAGVEREVLEWRKSAGGRTTAANPMDRDAGRTNTHDPITAPATDLARQWQGWGTALKPAWEPILLFRKPLIGTVAQNVQRWGCGGLNIDATRVGTSKEVPGSMPKTQTDATSFATKSRPAGSGQDPNVGRWPANLILDPEAGALLDAQTGTLKSGSVAKGTIKNAWEGHTMGAQASMEMPVIVGSTGGASRFFYCAKASRSEREAGLGPPVGYVDPSRGQHSAGRNSPRAGAGRSSPRANTHPTVKPLALMRWLVRLITPPHGLTLDPFAGSGSTGCAAAMEGFHHLGIELDPAHAALARERVAHWSTSGSP